VKFPVFKINRLLGVLILMTAVAVTGCSSTGSYTSFEVDRKPLFGNKAKQIFDYEGLDRNPVIGIPGIFGSRLINSDNGEVVWGQFTGLEMITKYSKAKIRLMSLPMEKGKSFLELGDNVVPDGPLSTVKVRMLGLPLNVNAYNELAKILESGGYVGKNSKHRDKKKYLTAFGFGYDWRRDLVYNVRQLDKYVQEQTKYLQEKYEEVYGVKDYDVRFDIIAHSMGGLITRYYLRYGTQDLPEDGSLPKLTWEGAKHIDRAVIVGTPNAGYLDAFTELTGGLVFAPGAPEIAPGILGTFPTLYQMLPQAPGSLVDSKDGGKALDIFDPDLWIEMKWGLADPRQDKILKNILPGVKTVEERRSIALDHLRKSLRRARQFTNALAVDAAPPQGTELHLFLGNSIWTNAVATVHEKSGKIKILPIPEIPQVPKISLSHDKVKVINVQPGDGKVAAASAIFDRRAGGEWQTYVDSPIHWKSITFLFAAHMGLTSDPVFGMNMLYILLGEKPEARK